MSEESIELEAQLIERVVEKRNLLLEEADKKTAQILKSAKAEVAKIEANSEAEILRLVGSELRASKDRILGRAELEGRRGLMDARQKALSKVYDEVSKRLKDISEGNDKKVDYGDLLVSLVMEAATAIGGQEFVIYANDSDLKYLGKNLGNINAQLNATLGECTIKLADEPIDTIGGVVVRNGDGTKTYHNTLDGRLGNVKNKLAAKVAGILGVI